MLSKRIWAMMGVVYMVIIILLMVYWMATMDLISGITGIMLFPAFAALSAQFFNRRWIIRHGRVGHVEDTDFQEPPYPQPGGGAELARGIVCGIIALVLLIVGIFQLIAYLTT
ncbi:MAG: hypothetical protein LUG58_04410 [Clostridiales bacterium]|nr:hypothetical protein [Clostridiales bacterium]